MSTAHVEQGLYLAVNFTRVTECWRGRVMNNLSNVHTPRIHPQFVYRPQFLSWLKRLLEMRVLRIFISCTYPHSMAG